MTNLSNIGLALDRDTRVDQDRLWASLMAMAQVGPGVAGGNNRQALTDEDGAARTLFARWCQDADMEIQVDQMGNIFAMRPGTDPDAAPVCVGSHLDTQPAGGRFDGILGVLAGLEVVRTLNDRGIRTKHPIVVTNWTNEEGSRFAPVMMASGVFAGVHSVEWAYARQDRTGVRFGDELERIGWKGRMPVGSLKLKAYYELHIEQGPILEAESTEIGVVTGGQGLTWLQVNLQGRSAHAGSTPMARRRNAGLGAARVMELVQQVAMSHQPHAVGTVGRLELRPNSTNSVPGSAELAIDIRSPDAAVLAAMEASIRQGVEAIAGELELTFTISQLQHAEPVAFDASSISTVRHVAASLGYTHRDIVSGAGHDAYWLSRITPTAMIMCPCVDGISHNEAEDISPEWAGAGANVLLHAVAETALVDGAADAPKVRP
ncbi:Amidase, hydantoinase/carbamoylase family [Paraburkholderia piptadeniae]|uniref:Amidase, hydantoinase/carbamoylase family n=1 Tax=Paraburkholderia piptadeniae TaxID=1701573 RepID=A0A1N7RVV0_9BURK|nr:Zn-dependent hydrolase [Paraburkholderia piptadeniae]SIT39240.1 Amidase, hydantoinase/carbamoylase family [Paraburkholderia piptadeniae]